MKKNVIRLNETQLRQIVAESVKRILNESGSTDINEIGDKPKGQRALGALAQRHALKNPNYDARDTSSKEAKIYDYAKKARGGDTYDHKGNPLNPMYKDYANGSIDYLNSHTDELMASRKLKESEEMPGGDLDDLGNDEEDVARYDDNGYLKDAKYGCPLYDDINKRLHDALGGGEEWAIVDRAGSDTHGRNIVIASNNPNTLQAVTSVMAEMGYRYLQTTEISNRYTADNINMSFHKNGAPVHGVKMKNIPGSKESIVTFMFAKRSK